MMNRTEVIEMARDMPDKALLDEYVDTLQTLRAPGYADFPDEAREQAVEVAREEILRRMRSNKENS